MPTPWCQVGLNINFSKKKNFILNDGIAAGEAEISEVSSNKYLGHEIKMGKDH